MSEIQIQSADADPLHDPTQGTATPSDKIKLPKTPRAPKRPKPSESEQATGEEASESAPKAPKKTKKSKDGSSPQQKRGQARPHKRLQLEVITARLEKLNKRIERTSQQLADARRHAEGYNQEIVHRNSENPNPLAAELESLLESQTESHIQETGEVSKNPPALPQ